MSKWVCEDVGLFINELRDRYGEKLNELSEKEEKEMSPEIENIIRGFNYAYDILDEVADNWTCDEPPAEVMDKLKKHYGEMDFE